MTIAYTGEVTIHKREEIFHMKKSITSRTDGYTLAMQKFSLRERKMFLSMKEGKF